VFIKTIANINSFQAMMKADVVVTTIPGAASRNITLKRAPKRVQPSTIAASSRATGIELK
jgi:hypothetical protein